MTNLKGFSRSKYWIASSNNTVRRGLKFEIMETVMNIEESKDIIRKVVGQALQTNESVNDDMALVGGNSQLDSMKLVEVCLSLEDEADDIGFEFDWTSDATMSKSRSMFRTVENLATEFFDQWKNQQ